MSKFYTVSGFHTWGGETTPVIEETLFSSKKEAAQKVAEIANDTLAEIELDDDNCPEIKYHTCLDGYSHDIHGDVLQLEVVEHSPQKSAPEPPKEKWVVGCSSFDGWEYKLYPDVMVFDSKDKAIDFILQDYADETEGYKVRKLRINRRKAKSGDQFFTPDMENKYSAWVLRKI